MSAPIDDALGLVNRTGWYVLPVRGKAPTSPHGLHDSANDPDEIARLFTAYPGDGLAVDCGRSGLVILDVDMKPGCDGRDFLREAGIPWLEADTPRASTPRGGEHVFFAGSLPSRISALHGVDVKSQLGYVVAPPGPGRAWLADASPWDLSPVPVPAWLQSLAGPSSTGAPRWAEAALGIVEEGGRNETAASIAGHLLRRKVNPRLAFVLLAAWGRSFCDPPLSDRESLAVFRSIAKREGAV
jgi:Bifunctional DNA primase/polymerase, N-terminal/Primase C terminal 1 (PriCT-1)